jgi:hypothetical protein
VKGKGGATHEGRVLVERQLRSRHVYLPLITFACMGFVFPGVALLTRKFGSPRPGEIAACSSFSFDAAGAALLVLAVVTIAWPLAFRRLNSALYFMAWAFPWAGTTASWFFLGAIAIVACTPLPYSGILLPALNLLFSTVTLAAFWLVLRPRVPLAIEANPPKWDFDKMEYSLFASAMSPQRAGRTKRDAAVKSGIAAFATAVGVLIVVRWILDWTLTRHMSLAAARDWEGTSLLMAISYGVVLVALGQAYAMYVVYRKCVAVGGKMRIREFSR